MSEDESANRHHTILSILIALTATTGALVNWYASKVGGAASGEDGKAITAALAEASTESEIAADAFGYLTNARRFQIHRDNEREVRADAFKNADVPDRWIDEWQAESIRARARLDQINPDFTKTDGGRWVFDRERYESATRSEMGLARALDPAPFIARAGALRKKGNQLVALNALFAAAIFSLTAALKTERRGKLAWTLAGWAIYLAGAVFAVVRILS
jgi:hypothetical protein